MTAIRRILFATDLSRASDKAFATAVTLAKSNRALLTILNVTVPFAPAVPEEYLAPDTWERLNRQARQWSESQVRKWTDRAKKAGIRAIGVVVEGAPAQQIVKVARSKRADLLVVGTHGRTGLARFFVGSVASRLVAASPCPVLTVRGR